MQPKHDPIFASHCKIPAAPHRLFTRIEQQLAFRQQQGLTRTRTVVANDRDTHLCVDGQTYINFSSNDYLGLAQDKQLIDAWQQGLSRFGAGSSASPLVVGFHACHQNLERQLCEWLGFERAILFNSGFSANQAMLFSLLEQGDWLFQDKLNHASLMEAGALSAANMRRFKHNDVQHLKSLLKTQDNALVVTEGVFSMDGDCAPLQEINLQCQQYNALLAVDDAHGLGVFGAQGQGSCHTHQIKPQLLVVTFGKALGVSGAAIMCNESMANYLTQFARHYVYSTAMPPAQAYAVSEAIAMVKTQQWRRDKLTELCHYYEEQARNLTGYQPSETAIKPYLCGSAQRSVVISAQLQQQGAWVSAIRPPTVAKNKARLRVTLTAHHTRAQIDALISTLQQAEEVQHAIS